MAWLVLGIAVITEILWALSLKRAGVSPGLASAAVPIALSFVNMALLAYAMRGIPAPLAYAVWTGLGAVGVAVAGALFMREPLAPMQYGFMALVVVGVVGMKLGAPAAA